MPRKTYGSNVWVSWPPTLKWCFKKNVVKDLWTEKLAAKWPPTLLPALARMEVA